MENKPYPKTGQNQNLLAIFDEIPADRQALIPEEDTDFCRQLQTQFDNVHDALGKKYDEVRFEAQLLQDYSVDFLPDSKVTYKLPRDKTKRTPFDQFLFLPFESIDKIVYLHDAACRRLCTMITDYFNRKYNLTIPSFNLGSDTLASTSDRITRIASDTFSTIWTVKVFRLKRNRRLSNDCCKTSNIILRL